MKNSGKKREAYTKKYILKIENLVMKKAPEGRSCGSRKEKGCEKRKII